MANIKSAIKRIEVAKRQTLHNKSRKSEIKTYIKKFETALENNNLDEARELLKLIDKKLKRASLANVIHPNAASRRTSQLQKKLNKATA
ncbi:MAG: 30S ribosomal protein S20 [Tissierellia bacterium]|nr:30S ribosomal protein S20 [Tissierellia bacterium]